MSAMSRVRVAIAGAALAATALLGGSAAVGEDVAPNTFEAAVLATPTPNAPLDQARGLHVDRSSARHVHLAAASAAAATCDGCLASAESLQVVYARSARSVEARNVVTAWAAGCANCRSRAVSVQVVIAESAASVRAVNRAMAVNAGCRYCTVSAVAVQFVVVEPAVRRLPAETVERLRASCDRLGDGPPSSGLNQAGRHTQLRAALIAAGTLQMKTQLASTLGAPVTSHLQISHG